MAETSKEEDGRRSYSQLSSLLRAYGALSPANPSLIGSPPLPDRRWLAQLDNQDALFRLLVLQQPDLIPHGAPWKKTFWKNIIASLNPSPKLEEEEIDERILQYYISLLDERAGSALAGEAADAAGEDGAPDGEAELHRYFYGDLADRRGWRHISVYENKACISNGTTGLRSWGASVCLANYLLLNPALLARHPTVVELGSGAGLLGILAHQLRPANRVILTDAIQAVLDRLQLNINLNQPPSTTDLLSVHHLDWNQSLASSSGGGDLLSLTDDGPLLLLGADVIYDPDLVPGLVRTIKHLLQAHARRQKQTPHTAQAFICSIVRNPRTWELFLACCQGDGLETVFVDVGPAVKLGAIDQPGIIFAQSLDHSDVAQNVFRLASLSLATPTNTSF